MLAKETSTGLPAQWTTQIGNEEWFFVSFPEFSIVGGWSVAQNISLPQQFAQLLLQVNKERC